MLQRALTCLSLLCNICLAQKVEVLHRSDFRHDYVVGQLAYIERPADTSRLKYIATLKVTQEKYDGIIEPLVERLVTEGKELGANSYLLHSFEESGSTISITVRTFFGPEKFLTENEKYFERGKIYIFSAEKADGRKQYFYLNDSVVEFPSTKFYVMDPGDNARLKITSHKPLPGLPNVKLPHKFRKKELSQFMIIKNHLNAHLIAIPLAVTAVALTLISGGTMYFTVSSRVGTKEGEIAYKHGRMLLDMYKIKTN